MLALYGNYKCGKINRRFFIRKLAGYAGGTAAAITMFSMLEKNYAAAVNADGSQSDLHTEFVTYPTPTHQMRAFLARPVEKKKYPAVIVIHENRGLQPHIMDVNKRMAKEGFLSLAPDALSPVGGTPEGDSDKAIPMLRELDMEQTKKNFAAAVQYLKTHPLSNGKVGCTGFCWGGAMTNHVAVASPDLNAAAPYYGSTPAPGDVPKIKAPIMAHFAENDERINQGIPAFEEALKRAKHDYRIYVYKGTGHGFNNDTNPGRYHEEAAKQAWERTVTFFKEKLKL